MDEVLIVDLFAAVDDKKMKSIFKKLGLKHDPDSDNKMTFDFKGRTYRVEPTYSMKRGSGFSIILFEVSACQEGLSLYVEFFQGGDGTEPRFEIEGGPTITVNDLDQLRYHLGVDMQLRAYHWATGGDRP